MIPQAFSNTTFNDLFTPHVGWEDIKSNIVLSNRRVSDETRQCNETVPQNMRQMGVANLARRNLGEEDIEKGKEEEANIIAHASHASTADRFRPQCREERSAASKDACEKRAKPARPKSAKLTPETAAQPPQRH